MPNGTFTRKTDGHPNSDTSQPPSTGPSAPATDRP